MLEVYSTLNSLSCLSSLAATHVVFYCCLTHVTFALTVTFVTVVGVIVSMGVGIELVDLIWSFSCCSFLEFFDFLFELFDLLVFFLDQLQQFAVHGCEIRHHHSIRLCCYGQVD